MSGDEVGRVVVDEVLGGEMTDAEVDALLRMVDGPPPPPARPLIAWVVRSGERQVLFHAATIDDAMVIASRLPDSGYPRRVALLEDV